MDNELYHYGVKGQKWGVRRFQDKSGRLTPAGKKRARAQEELDKAQKKAYRKDAKDRMWIEADAQSNATYSNLYSKKIKSIDKKIQKQSSKKNVNTDKVERLKFTNEYNKAYKDHYSNETAKSIKELETHVSKMQKKYGTAKVRDINTRTMKSGETYVKSVVPNLGTLEQKLLPSLEYDSNGNRQTVYVPARVKYYAY